MENTSSAPLCSTHTSLQQQRQHAANTIAVIDRGPGLHAVGCCDMLWLLRKCIAMKRSACMASKLHAAAARCRPILAPQLLVAGCGSPGLVCIQLHCSPCQPDILAVLLAQDERYCHGQHCQCQHNSADDVHPQYIRAVPLQSVTASKHNTWFTWTGPMARSAKGNSQDRGATLRVCQLHDICVDVTSRHVHGRQST